jgi:hypothetical protein
MDVERAVDEVAFGQRYILAGLCKHGCEAGEGFRDVPIDEALIGNWSCHIGQPGAVPPVGMKQSDRINGEGRMLPHGIVVEVAYGVRGGEVVKQQVISLLHGVIRGVVASGGRRRTDARGQLRVVTDLAVAEARRGVEVDDFQEQVRGRRRLDAAIRDAKARVACGLARPGIELHGDDGPDRQMAAGAKDVGQPFSSRVGWTGEGRHLLEHRHHGKVSLPPATSWSWPRKSLR